MTPTVLLAWLLVNVLRVSPHDPPARFDLATARYCIAVRFRDPGVCPGRWHPLGDGRMRWAWP